MFSLSRSEHNPILSPDTRHPFESTAAFNASPIFKDNKLHLVYRAMSRPELLKEPRIKVSTIAHTSAVKDFDFEDRHVLISPDADFDAYGCEDPRVTKLGRTYYIFYTALGGYPFSKDNIKVAVALSTDLEEITQKHLVTPFNAKAMALFPEKINGKMAALLTVHTDDKPSYICYAEFDKKEDIWSEKYWKTWHDNLDAHKLHIARKEDDHVELGAVPIKTEEGWLVVYAHIQNYGSEQRVFGIEILLLDLENPRTIIGRTKGPVMVPETYYEHVGEVPHTIFPSGALVRENKLEIYYGATDTHTAVASILLDTLMPTLEEDHPTPFARYKGNPIITPRPDQSWEAGGTFNPAAIELDETIHILYRAVAEDGTSRIGYATSRDGLSVDERLDEPIYSPRSDFESRGCEDARIVEIGDKLFITYTGYDGNTPRVAVSSIATKDFLARNFTWSDPFAITPPSIMNKDAAILPRTIDSQYLILHRVGESICADLVPTLDFKTETVDTCIEILPPRRGMWDGEKVGIAAPPIETDEGWVLLYHGVSEHMVYRVGAVLLDKDDPTIVRSRTAAPIFEPQEDYEKKGIVNNVVFPCGVVVREGSVYMYYGGGDKVVGVATAKLSDLLKTVRL